MTEACIALQPVNDGISDNLRDEIRTLVDAKYLVDKLARDRAGTRLIGEFHDGAYGPRHGTELFRDLFPFADIKHDGEEFSALVPTAQTIGASWKWTTSSLSGEERQKRLSFLQAPERAAIGATERAEYIWIKPLGLFLAHEGKNRVGFFRDMRVDWIPARVLPCRYVAAERLAIYLVSDDEENPSYWAVLDGKWLEPIQHPGWAVPVLRAYGVHVHRTWPSDFPSKEVTATALMNRLPDSISHRLPALNLPLVREKHEYQGEAVSCSLLDIDGVKLPWRYLLSAAAVSTGALLILGTLPLAWVNMRIFLGITAGIGWGTMLMPVLRVWRLPRRLVDPHAGNRKFATKETAPSPQ